VHLHVSDRRRIGFLYAVFDGTEWRLAIKRVRLFARSGRVYAPYVWIGELLGMAAVLGRTGRMRWKKAAD